MPAHEYRPARYPPQLQRQVERAIAFSIVALVAAVVLVAPWLSGMRASSTTWLVLCMAVAVGVGAAIRSWMSVVRLAAELGQPAHLPPTELGPIAGSSAPLKLEVPPPAIDADDVLLVVFALILGACFLLLLLGPLQGGVRLVALGLTALAVAAIAVSWHRRHLGRRWATHPAARETVVDSLGWSIPTHLLWPRHNVDAPAIRVPWPALRRLTVNSGGSDSPDTYDLELGMAVIHRERHLSVLRSAFHDHEVDLLDRLRVAGVTIVVRDEVR